jgi:hypothetical protein
MALTYGQPEKMSVGGRWLTLTDVTLDTKYPTGGYELEGAKLGLPDGLLDRAFADVGTPTAGATGYPTKITKTGKLQLYAQNKAEGEALKEVASEADVHTITVKVVAVGR